MRPKRVLVLDDNPEIRRLLNRFFSGRGLQVDSYACLEDAQVGIAANSYGLAIIDLRLSNLDMTEGLDGLKAVKQHNPRARLIVLTGLASPEVHKLAHEMGAAQVLCKPLDLDGMQAILDQTYPGLPRA